MAQTPILGVLPMSTARNAGKPHHTLLVNLEAERATLAGVMRSPDAPTAAQNIIHLDIHLALFTRPTAREAFTAITAYLTDGIQPDAATLRATLNEAALIEVETSLQEHASAANLPIYAQLLHDAYHARQRHAARAALAKQLALGADLATLRAALSELERIDAADPRRQPGDILLESTQLIPPQALQWLWPSWLARGKLHLLAGLPGTGKTTLALALAATVSSGGRFPDGSTAKPGRVVIWSSEDDVEDTIVPRLIANGADRRRIDVVRAVQDHHGQRLFDPATDLPQLQATLEKSGDTDLVILDSIADAVTGDSHKNAEVRRALFPVTKLAEAAQLAVIGVAHFNKSVGSDAMNRIVGSIGFAGMARLVMVAFAHPAHGHLLMRAKSNLGPDNGGYRYEIQQTPLQNYIELSASRVLWGNHIEGSANDLLRQGEIGDGRLMEDDGDLGVQLLTDLHAYFEDRTAASYPTAELLAYLTEIDDAPWATFAKGKAMTAWHLGRLLHPYGIVPQTIRVSATTMSKGYKVADFKDAFTRYLESLRNSVTSTSSRGRSPDLGSVTLRSDSVTDTDCYGVGPDCYGVQIASSASQTAGCDGVTELRSEKPVVDKQPPAAQPVDNFQAVDNFSAKPLPPLTACSNPTSNADPTGGANGSAVKLNPKNGNRWGTLQTTLWWDEETSPALLSQRKRR
jgi:putative DNA primase/helicase